MQKVLLHLLNMFLKKIGVMRRMLLILHENIRTLNCYLTYYQLCIKFRKNELGENMIPDGIMDDFCFPRLTLLSLIYMANPYVF